MALERTLMQKISDNVASCSLVAVFAILVAIGALSYNSTQRFLNNDRWVTHTYQVTVRLDKIISDLKDAETGQRGYLLTGDTQYLQPYQSGRSAVQEDIKEARILTEDNPVQQRNLDTLQPIVTAKLIELNRTIAIRRHSGLSQALRALQSGRGKDLMDRARETIAQMESEEQHLLVERTSAAENAGVATKIWNICGSLLGGALIVISIVFVGIYLRQRESTELENIRLIEIARDAALQQRLFLKDVLSSVTEGKLTLCDIAEELPLPIAGADQKISLSTTAGLRELRQSVIRAAHACGFSEGRVQDLTTSVSEAGMNAITHGGGGQATIRSDGNQKIQVWIEDHGKGIALDTLPQSTLERGYSSTGTLGHGFWLMLKMTDRISLLTGPQGTTVVLEHSKVGQEAPWLQHAASTASLVFKTTEQTGPGSLTDMADISFRTRQYQKTIDRRDN